MNTINQLKELHEVDEKIYALERMKFGKFSQRVYLFQNIHKNSMFISVCPATFSANKSILITDITSLCKSIFSDRYDPIFELIMVLEYSLNHCCLFCCDPRIYPWIWTNEGEESYPSMVTMQKYEFIITMRNHFLLSFPSLSARVLRLCEHLQELLDVTFDDVSLQAFHRNVLDMDYYGGIEHQDQDVGNDYAVAVNILPNLLRQSYGVISLLSFKMDIMLKRAGIMIISMIASPLWFMMLDIVESGVDCKSKKSDGYPYVRPKILRIESKNLLNDNELVADICHSLFSNSNVSKKIVGSLTEELNGKVICGRLLSVTLSRYNNYPLWTFGPHSVQILDDENAFAHYIRLVATKGGILNNINEVSGASSLNIETVNELALNNTVRMNFSNRWIQQLPVIKEKSIADNLVILCNEYLKSTNLKCRVYSTDNNTYFIGDDKKERNIFDEKRIIEEKTWDDSVSTLTVSDGKVISKKAYLSSIIEEKSMTLKNEIVTFALNSADNSTRDIYELIENGSHCIGTFIPLMSVMLQNNEIGGVEIKREGEYNFIFAKFSEQGSAVRWTDWSIDPILFLKNNYRIVRPFDLYELYSGQRGVNSSFHRFKEHMIFMKSLNLKPICGYEDEGQTVFNTYNFLRKCASTDLRLYFEFSDLSAYKSRFSYLLTKYEDIVFTSRASPLAMFLNGTTIEISGHLIALMNLYMLYGIDLKWYLDTIIMHIEKKRAGKYSEKFSIERNLKLWHSKLEYNLTFGYIEMQVNKIDNMYVRQFMLNLLVLMRNRMRF